MNTVAPETVRWIKRLAGAVGTSFLIAVLGLGLFHFYRSVWEKGKRLRVTVPGKLYRSGQMTEEGFADAVRRYGIKSIVNVQQEFPDPKIRKDYLTRDSIGEQEMCRNLGVKYIHVKPDLVHLSEYPQKRPAVLDEMLAVYDDPENYPMLIHCKAGLHRTGLLAALYRVEHQGWTTAEAYREMKAQGFGDKDCTESNLYVKQYLLDYQPRWQASQVSAESPQKPCSP